MTLKSQLVTVLNTISNFVGFPAKYVFGLAAWAVEKYVPDAEAGHTVADGARAAPADIRDVVKSLFARAVSFIPSGIARRMAEQAFAIVVDDFLDMAWDSLLGRLSRAPMTGPAAETCTAKVTDASVAFLTDA